MLPPRAARRVLAGCSRTTWTCPSCSSRRSIASKAPKPADKPAPDHRKLGTTQELFLNSVYSPGSPIFLPNGARIFNRLVDFLRLQYVRYGFDEVITPTIYKKALWAKSGHLENYADDMYTVTGKPKESEADAGHQGCGGHHEPDESAGSEGEYGLKPMNCPGHCIIFASQVRSYRDLPIRYADFGALHRNEISGALSGLTRTRRFHQDDGHIFCRPSQVEEEINSTLDFVNFVYVKQLGMSYTLALSTRPDDHFIGTKEEWDRAEAALTRSLDASGQAWTIKQGDGAFYGPKIDIVLKDSMGKEHQTATIQLDFQLPKRFELEYSAPAPEFEARGETTTDVEKLAEYGPVRPVMIHRAVLGSVERMMALLTENYNGKWPFWLNPRQVIVLTVVTSREVLDHASHVRDVLLGKVNGELRRSHATGFAVDIDSTATTLASKVKRAREKGYSVVLVVGKGDVARGSVTRDNVSISPEQLLEDLRETADLYQ